MDKYSKAIMRVIEIPIGVFCILIGIAFIGLSFWVSSFSDVASMILLMSLLGGGMLINFGLGYAFLGDEYKSTHLVCDGRTMYAPVETPKFLKRRKIVTFIGFIAYVLLAVYYTGRLILVNLIFADYFKEIDFDKNIVALIIFAILSLVVAFVFFMLYKKTKHIDLKEE
ncbi:MAG: hypothetical protein IJW82_03470 [Clostridia bacterium]|nr:hypothetical protein [Clostridia bacterium]